MLTRVDVQSENPFYLKIRDARPTDSIILEKIEGLDPPAIDLFMGDYARDGGFYSGRRVPPRNIVLTLRLNPNYKNDESVSGLRQLLYKAFIDPFDGADTVNLILHDDELADRYISGNVEKFETDVFSDEAVVTISMMCPNPYILDLVSTSLVGSGPQITFDYEGTAETGFILDVNITASTSYLQLDLNDRIMGLNYAFSSGDVVHINTVRGARQIQVTAGGITTNILYTLAAGGTWLEIHKPSNVLKVYGESAGALVGNVGTLVFRSAHWGV